MEKNKGAIHIVGLGCGDEKQLTLGTIELLQSGMPVYVRTHRHPSMSWLQAHDIAYTSFDDLYDNAEDFASLYTHIASVLVQAAVSGSVLYAVPGHPLVAERVSQILLDMARTGEVTVHVHAAVSAVDGITASLGIDPASGLVIQDALDYKLIATTVPQLILQVYSRQVASMLKLTLMENYRDEDEVILVQSAGVEGDEHIEMMKLYELDQRDTFDHLTSLYLPRATRIVASRYPLDPLVEVMEKLRGENGCPWDQEQDHLSLRRYCLEEACEVIAAINSGDTDGTIDELGDLMLQIAFHAQIGFEEGEYDLNDIVGAICAKMIRRHPHVFGSAEAESSEEVLLLWEQIKQRERGDEAKLLLHGVGKGLPALMRARKIQEKASSVGFDWPDASGAIAKVHEELGELLEAAQHADLRAMEMELGDLLFSVVNWSRFLGIDPELALHGSSDKFSSRFSKMEKESALSGKNLITMTLSELDVAWDSIKQHKD